MHRTAPSRSAEVEGGTVKSAMAVLGVERRRWLGGSNSRAVGRTALFGKLPSDVRCRPTRACTRRRKQSLRFPR
jgi:hypothetical protein